MYYVYSERMPMQINVPRLVCDTMSVMYSCHHIYIHIVTTDTVRIYVYNIYGSRSVPCRATATRRRYCSPQRHVRPFAGFYTMTMYSSDSSRIHNNASEFTAQASAHILERSSTFALNRNDDTDTDHPLLDELNINGYNEIKQLIQKTFPSCDVSKICQVYAPQMYGMYLLRMEEIKLNVGRSVREKLLYHVTTESRAMESLNSGLDWRRTCRNKFGCGVSFSDNADYANYYADNSPSEDTRIIMICCVLVRETYVVHGQNNGNALIVPPNNADTSVSYTGHVYVKYNDNEFYPLYFVYYLRRPEHRTTSKFYRANNRRRTRMVSRW